MCPWLGPSEESPGLLISRAAHLRPLTPGAPAAQLGGPSHLTSDSAGMSDRWLPARDSALLRDNSRRRAEVVLLHPSLPPPALSPPTDDGGSPPDAT